MKLAKDNKVRTTPKIQLSGKDGTVVEIDVSQLDATPAQKLIVEKLLASGKLDSLDKDEQDMIKDLKARIGLGGDPQALIVRFDWTWVRID